MGKSMELPALGLNFWSLLATGTATDGSFHLLTMMAFTFYAKV